MNRMIYQCTVTEIVEEDYEAWIIEVGLCYPSIGLPILP